MKCLLVRQPVAQRPEHGSKRVKLPLLVGADGIADFVQPVVRLLKGAIEIFQTGRAHVILLHGSCWREPGVHRAEGLTSRFASSVSRSSACFSSSRIVSRTSRSSS